MENGVLKNGGENFETSLKAGLTASIGGVQVNLKELRWKGWLKGRMYIQSTERHQLLEALFNLTRQSKIVVTSPPNPTNERPGLTREEYMRTLNEQIRETAQEIRTVVLTNDPIPPFDLTVVFNGVTTHIYGITIVQESGSVDEVWIEFECLGRTEVWR